jgi:NADH-quinone oxidoreductase subunit F
MILSAYALSAEKGFVYLRGEYPHVKGILETAISEAMERQYLGDNVLGKGIRFDVTVHLGAGAYICGEETALVNSLEGKRGQPRIKPPFPVNEGFMGKPTIINNVETLCNVPHVIGTGAKAYSAIGNPECPGPKLFSVSGHVERPGVYELPMGTTLREIIYAHSGGLKNGRGLKAVIPGGISSPVLTPDKIDTPMDFVSLAKAGSMLGSGAVIVMDETTCIVKVAARAMQFYEHESCGKCTPCREGTGWLRSILERMESGGGRSDDLELLEDVARNIAGKTFCPLGDAAATVVLSFLKDFRREFAGHIEAGQCPLEMKSAA